MTDAATATAKPVKSDEEIKKDLTILEANPGPYDEKFIETHRKKIHDLLDRVKKSGNDGL
ncbi:MAG: hypothetical protein HUJ86_03595, partial [Synergistes sp.]|nr:hypothetical protein [Synergistes sp.]